MTKAKYKPDQSDRDALATAQTQGVKIYECTDGTWSWQMGGVGNHSFETKWHAARDSLIGLVQTPSPVTSKNHDVHIYAVVRYKYAGIPAESQTDAIAAADKLFAASQGRDATDSEYAEEITGYLVDEAGDEEYENTQEYDGDGKPLPGVWIDPAKALKALLTQLEGIGIAIPGQDAGQWAGTEGLSFARAYAAVGVATADSSPATADSK